MEIPPFPPPPPKQRSSANTERKDKEQSSFRKPFLLCLALSTAYVIFSSIHTSVTRQGEVATDSTVGQPTSQATAEAEPLPSKDDWRKLAKDNEIKLRWRCEDALKDRLKDPRSYQPIEIKYSGPLGNRGAVSVLIDYTAANSLGGSNRSAATCLADENAKVIDISVGK